MDVTRLVATPLAGLFEVHSTAYRDARGCFTRLFREHEFQDVRPGVHFAQANLSETALKGSVRGMHFQVPPAAEAKLIWCLRGRVYDVAVDVRTASPTYLHWHAIELQADSGRGIWIPEGYAHGFQALTDDVQLLYLHTGTWQPEFEAGLRHDDPALAIRWPLPATRVSDRDRAFPLLPDPRREAR